MEKFSNEITEQVIKGNEIVNLISQYVKLDKQGKNYFGLCPFHHEKTPSFSVSPEKQIFHCFSCGEGGNVVHFLAKIENITYQESLKRLGAKINLKFQNNNDDNNEESKYFEINQFVLQYYQFALLNTTEGKEALNYLYKRGIDDSIIKRFKIGLAPDTVNSLYLALKANGVTDLASVELGHVIKANDKHYDKFKKRIMFPIGDEYGNIVGFSGRIYEKGKTDEPKYINTQETPVFKKSHIIYNLDHAKKTIRQKNRVYLFEGFMDVIASVKSGLEEAVATMGTALTSHHIALLKRYTNNMILCYDGDNAGIEATKRAIDLLIKQNVNVSVVNLKEGLDPDEYVQKYGSQSYIDFLSNNQKSYKEYMYIEYIKDLNLNNISTVEAFKRRVFHLLLNSSPTEKELFLNKLHGDINVSQNTLQYDLKRYIQNHSSKDEISHLDIVQKDYTMKVVKKGRPSKDKLKDAEETLLHMCLMDRKNLIILSNDNSITFSNEDTKILYYDLANYYNMYETFNYEAFIEKYNKEIYRELLTKLISEYPTKKGVYNKESLEQCSAVIVNERIGDYVQGLKRKLKTCDDEAEKMEISQKIMEQLKIKKTKK